MMSFALTSSLLLTPALCAFPIDIANLVENTLTPDVPEEPKVAKRKADLGELTSGPMQDKILNVEDTLEGAMLLALRMNQIQKSSNKGFLEKNPEASKELLNVIHASEKDIQKTLKGANMDDPKLENVLIDKTSESIKKITALMNKMIQGTPVDHSQSASNLPAVKEILNMNQIPNDKAGLAAAKEKKMEKLLAILKEQTPRMKLSSKQMKIKAMKLRRAMKKANI